VGEASEVTGTTRSEGAEEAGGVDVGAETIDEPLCSWRHDNTCFCASEDPTGAITPIDAVTRSLGRYLESHIPVSSATGRTKAKRDFAARERRNG
jgi:hypothetical protein